MTKTQLGAVIGVLVLFVAGIVGFFFFGPMRSTFRPPDRVGQAMLVSHDEQPRLWVLLKQEEQRQVGYGGGGTRSTGGFRSDTFFHFDLQAHDVRSAAPVWTKRLLTLGDTEARGKETSRVIGSSTTGRLLGQEQGTVWLVLDGEPLAVAAADGKVVATAATLQEKNPALRGLLPATADLYAFDAGLVITAADAQRYRVQGATLAALPYQPPPPPRPAPATRWQSVRTLGEPMVRLTRLGGTWIGLYTDRESADAVNDELGRRFNEPHNILDEGKLARRTFRRAVTARSTRYADDTHDVLKQLTPVDGSPAYLRGRYFPVNGAEQALVLTGPAGVLVQHQTRIDAEGRVAITRIDADLKALWTATLPMTELDASARWIMPTQVLLLGTEQTVKDGVQTREEQLVTLDLADGTLRSWNLQKGQAAP